MELLKIIKNNQNWENILSNRPYSLSIKKDGEYVLFSYNLIESDFSLSPVCEARGVIFRKSDWKCVSRRFDKFFNLQETHASEIDWSSARVQEKLDGSLIALWFDSDKWNISTNGTIFAKNALLQTPTVKIKNYEDLFFSAINFSSDIFKNLNKDNTYIFEITSPFNRVVVPYNKTEIWHIGTRSNITFDELDEYIGVKKPKEFSLSSLEECLKATKEMTFSEEGYVVVDDNYNRVKIKSPAYVAAHHLKNNGVITRSRLIDMIKVNGQDDFLSVYPEYRATFEEIINAIATFIENCYEDWDNNGGRIKTFSDRKTFAQWATKTHCPPLMFALYDKKTEDNINDITNWLFSLQNDKILKLVGLEL